MKNKTRGKSIAILIGSLRKESFNRKLANAILDLAPSSLKMEIVEIGGLALYNEDYEDETPPEPWVNFRKKMKPMDGVVFVTPEYNRSVTAVLKNALDVGSRPSGQSIWAGKAGAVMSASPGKQGAFGANHHLRQSLVCLDVAVMAQPEAYIGGVKEIFNDQGALINQATKEFLKKFMAAYATWVSKIVK